MSRTKTVTVLLLLLLAGVGVFVWLTDPKEEPALAPEPIVELPPVSTTTQSVLGTSVEGRIIESYTFGTGDTDILLVGGIHGGYEWNTIVLAYEMIDHFAANPSDIPTNLTVHIVPNLNPDGLFEATSQEGRFTPADIPDVDIHTPGIGRVNANGVDLNRNFDCRWSPNGIWRGNSIGTGEGPFSEPEAVIIRDYIFEIEPAMAVIWHSRANNVYGSECGDPVADDTLALMNAYATAGDYGAVPVFDAYVVNGAIEDWLASRGVPAVSVELETRTDSEFARNLAGTLAALELYRE